MLMLPVRHDRGDVQPCPRQQDVVPARMICYEGRDVVHDTLVGDWSRRRAGRSDFLQSTGRRRTEQRTPDVSSSVVSSDVLLEVALEVGRHGRHGGSGFEW